jgi:hypothetical protein
MVMRVVSAAVVMAALAGFIVTSTPVRADDCDDIVGELKKLSERVMNDKNDTKTGPAICAAIGQVLGIIKATREVAAECYDDGKKRSDILLNFDKTAKEMEGQIDSVCK